MGIDFNKELKEMKLKKDKNFKGSLAEKLGFSEYFCPKCKAHLKKTNDDLICLNACHLPKEWKKDFHNLMKEIKEAIK